MGNCIIRQFDLDGNLKEYNCNDIEFLKSEFRKINHTDEILKMGRQDLHYNLYCQEIENFCKCQISLKCSKCSDEDHEGAFCRCEFRNIKLAKQLRHENKTEVNKAELYENKDRERLNEKTSKEDAIV